MIILNIVLYLLQLIFDNLMFYPERVFGFIIHFCSPCESSLPLVEPFVRAHVVSKLHTDYSGFV